MSNRRTFLKQTLLGSGALALGTFPEKLIASDEIIRLTVMHTNDIHCHLDPFPDDHPNYPGKGGLVRVAGIVNRARKENSNFLLLDAGDRFQGTPYFNYFRGELIVELMSKMGYDAVTIGNHEFDNGLGYILSAAKKSVFPLISSNYDFSDTILADQVKKMVVLRKNGIKIGLYGLGISFDGLVNKTGYENTRYLDPLETALNMEAILKHDHRCDLVICLSHLGLSYEYNKISDKTLAPQTKYTDLIVGGHTHTFLNKPVELTNSIGRPVLVNQAGWAGLEVGRIDFLFDRVNRKEHPVAVIQNN